MKKFTALAVFWIFGQVGFSQNTYFLSVSGDDTYDGSYTHPWRHFSYAVSQLQAGDTLYIRSGTYQGQADLSIRATASAPVIIEPYNDETVYISGNGLPAGSYLLKLENAAYVRISNLVFTGYRQPDAIGILILNSSDITIDNCEFSHIDFSASAGGQTPTESDNAQPLIVLGTEASQPASNIQITNGNFHDCHTGYSEVLALNGNVDGFLIENNLIYNNSNIGIDIIGFENTCPDPSVDQARNGIIRRNLVHNNISPYDEAAGIYVDGGKNVVIENNTTYQNDYGIEIGCENNGQVATNPAAENIVVRDNLIYANRSTGLALGGYDYPVTGKVVNAHIYNNTFFNNDTENNYNGEMYITYSENCTLENNIFYALNNDHVLYIEETSNPGMHFDYNLFYAPSGNNNITIEINGNEYNGFQDYQISTSRDQHALFANPLFQNNDSSDPDLHITALSPAVDAGNPSFNAAPGETDMDGEQRILNGRIDCGADEYNPQNNIELFFSENLIYPNPARHRIFIRNAEKFESYEILSPTGKQIQAGKTTKSIDISPLIGGIYLIRLKTGDNIFYARIIKE